MSAGDDQTFHDAIEAYCGALSYEAGSTVAVHVSTKAARFDLVVERWGAARELVHRVEGIEGRWSDVPIDADANGCGWPAGPTFEVDASWRSGFYLVTLTAHDVEPARATAHAGFVVRGATDPNARADTLYVLPTNTWNAYNTWGGKSLYTGGTQVSFARPFARGMLARPEVERDDRKARPTRHGEVADADGRIFQAYRTEHAYPSAIGSTGWFTHGRRFVEWAEGAGHRFDYAVSSDLEAPAAFAGYTNVVLVGHDEYWSAPARDGLEEFVRGGGNLASFSGNTMFWRVRIEPGAHGPTMVCHKYAAHRDDPVVAEGAPERATGMWADPSIGRPEWTLLGAGSAFGLYHRFGQATARGVGGFVVSRPDHWMLDGTGLGYGDVLGVDDGVVGYETVGCPLTFDDLAYAVPSASAVQFGVPADAEIVAWVPASNLGVGEYPASIAALSDQGDLEFIAERVFGGADDALERTRRGNAVIIICQPFGVGGGEVVTVGTTDWVFGLAGDPCVARVTANVLAHGSASPQTGPNR